MKIYNEVTTIFNDTTGKWETISEDSFEWNGSIDMAKVQAPKIQQQYDASLDYDSSGNINEADVAAFEAAGQVAQAQLAREAIQANIASRGYAINSSPLDTSEGMDKITDTIKVTAGYFPGGGGILTNTYMYTGSLANSNEPAIMITCVLAPANSLLNPKTE